MVNLYLGEMNDEIYNRDKEVVFAKYLLSANQGDVIAQYFIGMCYYKGLGVKENYEKAFYWFLKSAMLHNKDGQYMVGKCYQYGFGINKDEKEAFKWYLKSAYQENSEAQYSVGECYQYGFGVEIDIDKAFEWYQKSANIGNVKAIRKISKVSENYETLNMTLAEEYNVDAENYDSVSIGELSLSVRSTNCLREFDTVGDLLRKTENDLMLIKNCGRTSVNEIKTALKNYLENYRDYEYDENKVNNTEKFCLSLKDDRPLREILKIDDTNNLLVPIENLDIEPRAKNCLKRAGCYTVDKLIEFSPLGLMRIEASGKKTVSNICNQLFAYTKKISSNSRNVNDEVFSKDNVIEIIKNSKYDLTEKLVLPFVQAYRQCCNIASDSVLANLQDNIKFGDLMGMNFNDSELKEVALFVNWLNVDICEVSRQELLESIPERRRNILLFRAVDGLSLEAIGSRGDKPMTRERVRQLEKRAVSLFVRQLYQTGHDVVLLIRALCDGKNSLIRDDFNHVINKEVTDCLFYVLSLVYKKNHPKRLDDLLYRYNKELDSIIIGQSSQNKSEEAKRFFENLPNILEVEDFNSRVAINGIENKISSTAFKMLANKYFNTEGPLMSKQKLLKKDKFLYILKKYYSQQNGIKVSSEKEINHIKCLYRDVFDDNSVLEDSDRAIVALITNNGILCDKGTYCAFTDNIISNQLMSDICEFMNTLTCNVFEIQYVYDAFKERLLAEQINNKYCLYGILQYLLGSKWNFKRFFVTKDMSREIDTYRLVEDVIRKSSLPVSKAEIKEKIPGITDITITTALNKPDIVNLFGSYVSADKLSLSCSELCYLRKIIEDEFGKNNFCSTAKIYNKLFLDNAKSVLSNNFIYRPYSLFSVLEYYLADEYDFVRPFIIKHGSNISTTQEMLYEIVSESDKIEISKIVKLARDNEIFVANQLEYLCRFSNTHLITDVSTMLSIDCYNINESLAKEIENKILSELDEVKPVLSLKCLDEIDVNFRWDEWFIYSLIRKWGKKLDVMSSFPQWRYGTAIVGKKGSIDFLKYMGKKKEEIVPQVMSVNDVGVWNFDFDLSDIEGVND